MSLQPKPSLKQLALIPDPDRESGIQAHVHAFPLRHGADVMSKWTPNQVGDEDGGLGMRLRKFEDEDRKPLH